MPCGPVRPSAATSGYGHGNVSVHVLVSDSVAGGRLRGGAVAFRVSAVPSLPRCFGVRLLVVLLSGIM